MNTNFSGSPFGRNSRPAFLKSPTSSFFFVSTDMAGSPSGNKSLNRLVYVTKLRVTVGM